MTATAHRAHITGNRLVIDFGNGGQHVLHPLWLRERCPCAECRDPQTTQRLLDAWSVPTDIGIRDVTQDGDRLSVTFTDGHVAPFQWGELERILVPHHVRYRDLALWDATTLAALPAADWRDVQGEDKALHDMLQQLHRHAFVRVSNVPTGMDSVGDVVARIGPMRRTNWGGIADVKAIANAYDLTMTGRGLESHTDNPYREPVPGYIFLHCLANDADGGASTLTDGFCVAERLLETDPELFDVLTTVRPAFRYVDDTTILESSGPLIELDQAGQVRQVRLSNRTDAVDPLDPELLDRYYHARHRWTGMVNDPAFQIRFKLKPGELLIMDNYRVFHGRTSFRLDSGHRHMRQCYMDRDSVGSCRKVLARRFAAPSGMA